MKLPSASRFQCFASVAVLLTGGGCSSIFASAIDLTVSSCADIAALPITVSDDTNLFLDGTYFECDEVTTVNVDGRYQYKVTSANDNVKFRNVRFSISGRAKFSFDLAGESSTGGATFSGVEAFTSDGGAFYVENRSTVIFSVPMTFDSNSVFSKFSGGGVYSAGKVNFKYDTIFKGNKVLRDGDDRAQAGGALCVAEGGAVTFEDFASFKDNRAESGGEGGAVANFGSLVFEGVNLYDENRASEDGDGVGGDGGAIFTELGSITVLRGRAIMQDNRGSNGGALYNKGTTILENGAFFGSNRASGNDQAKGGHIYTSGYVSTAGDVSFVQGRSLEGGAVYVDEEGTLFTNDEVHYIGNTASENCPDVYARGEDPSCQQVEASVVAAASAQRTEL